jgi:hypothetical protein
MIGVLEAVFAVVGVVATVAAIALAAGVWLELRFGLFSGEESADAPDPYDEALAASARISAMAYEAHQAMQQTALVARRDEDQQ